VERLLQLQQLAFQNAQQGKHLAEQALAERRKAAGLLSSVSEKAKNFTQTPNSEGKSLPPRREIEELQQAITHLEKTVLTRSEDQVASYVRTNEQLEKEIADNWEALKEVSASKAVPKEVAFKLRECEQTMKKITTYVDENRKYRIEIQGNRAATEKALEEVPQLQEQLTTFIGPEPLPDPQTGEIVVEEEQEYRAESVPQEMEVAHEPGEEVEEENMDKGVWEVEVAAEVVESPEDVFSQVYDEFAVRSQQAAESVLGKVAEEAVPWEAGEVYAAFFRVLAHMQQLDLANSRQPLSPALATISCFLAAYPKETAANLSKFRAGLRQMTAEKAPFSDFIASVLNLDSPNPYPESLSAQLPCINALLDKALEAAAKLRPSGKREESLGGKLHLGAIATLFAPIFQENELMYGQFLERLHPASVKYADFLHYLLVYHMKQRNLDGIALFKQISDDNILDFDEFEYGVRHYLHWGIPADSLQTLFTMMQNPDSGLIFRLDFIRFLRLQMFVENEENEDFWVAKVQVLKAFGETCGLRRREFIVTLANKVREIVPDAQLLPPPVVLNVLQTLGEKREISSVIGETGAEGLSFEALVALIETRGLISSAKSYFRTDFASVERTPEQAEVPEAVVAFLAALI